VTLQDLGLSLVTTMASQNVDTLWTGAVDSYDARVTTAFWDLEMPSNPSYEDVYLAVNSRYWQHYDEFLADGRNSCHYPQECSNG
jgi:hypothetical protein